MLTFLRTHFGQGFFLHGTADAYDLECVSDPGMCKGTACWHFAIGVLKTLLGLISSPDTNSMAHPACKKNRVVNKKNFAHMRPKTGWVILWARDKLLPVSLEKAQRPSYLASLIAFI